MTSSLRSPYAALATDTIVGIALFSGPVFASVVLMSLLVIGWAYQIPAWLFKHAFLYIATAGCLGAVTGAALSSRQRLPHIRRGQASRSPWWGVLAGIVRFVRRCATDPFRIPAILPALWSLAWCLYFIHLFWRPSARVLSLGGWLFALTPAALMLGFVVRACTTPPRWVRLLVWGTAAAGLECGIILVAVHPSGYPENWQAFAIYAYLWIAWVLSCVALLRDRTHEPLHQAIGLKGPVYGAFAGGAVGVALGFAFVCTVAYGLHSLRVDWTYPRFREWFCRNAAIWTVLGAGTGAILGAVLGVTPALFAGLRRLTRRIAGAYSGRHS